MTSADNAISNAVSVLSQQNSADHASIRNLISIVSQAVSVVSADLASVRSDLTSNINAVSNAVSALSNQNSVDHASIRNLISGANLINAARVAATGSVNLSAPGTSVDGVSLVSGDRILVWQQTSAVDNGIYVFNGSGTSATRALDMDSDWNHEVAGRILHISEGTQYENFKFVNANGTGGTFGTTSVVFNGALKFIGGFSFGDSYTSARSGTAFGPRVFTMIDSNAVMRVWRFTGTGSNPGLEFVYGTNDDAANSANDWWDVTLNESPNAGVRIARRTGGVTTLKLFAGNTGVRIGTNVAETNPAVSLEINGTDAVLVPAGTTAQRPTGVEGYVRHNTTTSAPEYFANGAWHTFANTDIDISTLTSAINAVSNAVSVLSNQNSVDHASIRNLISIVSAELVSVRSNLQSNINAVSNNLSVQQGSVSNLSSAILANSAQMTSADNAISNAVSIVSQAVSVVSAAQAVTSAELTSVKNRVSDLFSIVSAANISNLNSIVNVVSNYASVVSAYASVVSNYASVVSNKASIVSATAGKVAFNSAFTLGGDQTVSATAVVSVSGMAFSLLSNATYNFRFHMYYSAAASVVCPQWALSAPAFVNMGISYDQTGNTAATQYSVVVNTQGTKMTGFTTTSAVGLLRVTKIEGQIATSASSGNLVLNVGNAVSGSSTSILIIKAGSWGQVTRVV